MENLAVAVSRHHVSAISSNKHIFCFDKSENIQNYLVVFLIRRNYVFYPQINDLIQRMSEAGFISKWANDHSIQQKIIPHEDDNNFKALNIENFLGIFILSGLGILGSIGIAIAEQVIYRKAKHRNAHHLWKRLSTLIDGQRHTLLFTKRNQTIRINNNNRNNLSE